MAHEDAASAHHANGECTAAVHAAIMQGSLCPPFPCVLFIPRPNHSPVPYVPAPMITVTRCAVPLIQELLPSTSTAPAGGLGTTNEEIAVPGGKSSSSTETPPSAGFMIRRDDSRRLMSAFSISIA